MTPREKADEAFRAVPWLYAPDRTAALDALEAAGLLIVDPAAGTDALLDAVFAKVTEDGPEPVDVVRARVETELGAWIGDPARLRAVVGDVVDLARSEVLREDVASLAREWSARAGSDAQYSAIERSTWDQAGRELHDAVRARR